MSKLYTTEAISTGDGRNDTVRTLDGVLEHQLAVPKEMGGPGGEKTNPEHRPGRGRRARRRDAPGLPLLQLHPRQHRGHAGGDRLSRVDAH